MSNRFLDGQMSGLVENFNIGIYSDTITGDKCQTLHNGTTDWAWPIRVTFNDLDDILRSERYLRGLTKKKKKMLLPDEAETLYDCQVSRVYNSNFHLCTYPR